MQRQIPIEDEKDLVVCLILKEMVKFCSVDTLIEQIITFVTKGKVPENVPFDFNAFFLLPIAGAHRVIYNLIKINEPLPSRAKIAGARQCAKRLFIVKKIAKRVKRVKTFNRKKLFIVKKYRK